MQTKGGGGPTTDVYVTVAVEAGDVSAVVRAIAALESVAAAHTVTGQCDVIARLDLTSKDDIPDVVADDIHGLDGVVDTVTNLAFEP